MTPAGLGSAPAIDELDGVRLQPLDPQHAPVVAELLRMRGHRYILELPDDADSIAALLAEVTRQPWSLPLAAIRGDECIGVATSALPNLKALHAGFTALFVDPATATTATAMCVRHLFWTFPLRRLHAQVPDLDLTREYIDLLTGIGFQLEGRLVDHLQVGGQTFDTVMLGLLRTDFDDWCDANEPRLSLRETTQP